MTISIRDIKRNPALNFKINPIHNWQINPIHNWSISPVHNWNINPAHNWNINPIHNWNINPVHNWQTNPFRNWQINPIRNWQINPMRNFECDPDRCSNLKGYFILDDKGVCNNFAIKAKSDSFDFLIIFDEGKKFEAFAVFIGQVYVVYNLLNKFIGIFISNGQAGYNWFNLQMNWKGYLV